VLKNQQIKEVQLDSVKGMTIGYEGEVWTMTDSMDNIEFYAPKGIDDDKRDAIKKALE